MNNTVNSKELLHGEVIGSPYIDIRLNLRGQVRYFKIIECGLLESESQLAQDEIFARIPWKKIEGNLTEGKIRYRLSSSSVTGAVKLAVKIANDTYQSNVQEFYFVYGKKPIQTYPIESITAAGGSIQPQNIQAQEGKEYVFTLTANEGYTSDSAYYLSSEDYEAGNLEGKDVPILNNEVHVTANPLKDVVYATFKVDETPEEVTRLSFGHYIGDGNSVPSISLVNGVNRLLSTANKGNYGDSTEIASPLKLTSSMGNEFGYIISIKNPTVTSGVYNANSLGVAPDDLGAYSEEEYTSNIWWKGGYSPRSGSVKFSGITPGTYAIRIYGSSLDIEVVTSNTTYAETSEGNYAINDSLYDPYNSNKSWAEIQNVMIGDNGELTLTISINTSSHTRVPINIIEFSKQ